MAEKKCSEHLIDIFSFTKAISNICGADVLRKDYRICWKTRFVFFLINSAIALTFYTAYKEAYVKGHFENILKSASILGTGLQGYTKLVNTVMQQDKLRYLHKEINEIYKTYENIPSYNKYLQGNILLVKKLLATLLSIIIVITIIVIGVPVVMLVVFENRMEVLPFQIPFLDEETDFGFYSKFGIQVVCVLFGGFGNFVIDTWLFIFAANIPLVKNILKCKFDDLNAILDDDPRNIAKSMDPLKDIFKFHQKYNAFCDTIRKTFFWVIFVQISTEFFGITCTILCIFLDLWLPAPFYLFYLFGIVYAYCFLGNLVEVSNDDVINIIYDSNWYNLTVPEQKMILIMLRESQQATSLSIGGVAPLSLNTALQLTKTIYTLTMLLESFLNKK